MCAVAFISFVLAWKYPFFWLVFLWSLWAMSRRVGVSSCQYRSPVEPPHNATLYDVLEVSPHASPEVIKAAYRQLALKYHPDRQPTAQARIHAEERMKQINAAYAILSDPARRREYDRQIGIGFSGT